MDAAIRERLAGLDPVAIDLRDDSASHAGHSGARAEGGTHWSLDIVSPQFEGRNTVARHRLVYAALGDLMNAPIHALQIRARTPQEADRLTP